MEPFHWYKVTLEFLKGNKVFFLLVSTALASGTAGYKLPDLINSKPVEVTVQVPVNNDIKEIKDDVKKIKEHIKYLRGWHGG